MSSPATAGDAYPESRLRALDTLWIQVAGTVCNLQCTHCFISCSPSNHSHGMMTLAEVRAHLEDAAALGVRDYYFTGGEPFLNRELPEMIAAALAQGPVSVLTNGLLIRRETAERLRALADASPHRLEIRVSLDGMDAAANDAVRGAGTFERILAAVGHLAGAGLPPIVTVTEACAGADTAEGRDRLLALLRAGGAAEPRLKVLPLLRIGAEPQRSRAYCDKENLRGVALDDCAQAALQCSSSRMVTSRGAYVCPILIDFPEARMGARLQDALGPFTLRHSACFTCHRRGLSCRN